MNSKKYYKNRPIVYHSIPLKTIQYRSVSFKRSLPLIYHYMVFERYFERYAYRSKYHWTIRECNDHSFIQKIVIATYLYRIIRHFCIRLSLIVLCHTFITDPIECQNIAIMLCMYTNHNNAHHCYHTHILTRLLYKS